MNIKIRTTNFDLTPAIEEYVVRKIEPVSKFLHGGENALCEVELGKTTNHHKSGDIFRAEVNIVMPGKNQFFATAEEADLYVAIDIVRDQIEREIISKKTRRETLFRRGATRIKFLLKQLTFRK